MPAKLYIAGAKLAIWKDIRVLRQVALESGSSSAKQTELAKSARQKLPRAVTRPTKAFEKTGFFRLFPLAHGLR
jgi:hypothetical protein